MSKCRKCGSTNRYPSGGCIDCSKRRNEEFRRRKGQKKRKEREKKYCSRCDRVTERLSDNKCKPCSDRYKNGSLTQADIKEREQCRRANEMFALFNRSLAR